MNRFRPILVTWSFLVLPAILPAAQQDVVINEIHYHPAADDEGSEFVELFNSGPVRVSLGGWRFTRGISFIFPDGLTIEPGGFLVVARDLDLFRRRHPDPAIAAIGNFEGRLANSGERIELRGASDAVIESLRYSDHPPYPTRPDGNGPTLERRSAAADNDRPGNWRASLPRWELIEASGPFPASVLTLFLKGPGEVIIDDLSLTLAGSSAPLIPDGGFESGIAGWTFAPSHRGSRHETGEAYSGKGALRLVSNGTGSASSARLEIVPPIPAGAEVRVSFRARWAAGVNSLDYGSPGALLGPVELLGTPGRLNSVRLEKLPPEIHLATHEPPAPRSTDPIAILAVVTGEEPITEVLAEIHDGTGATAVALRDDGLSGDGIAADGLWGARLAPRPHGTVLRYRLTARDRSGAEERFPIPGEPTRSRACRVDDRPAASALPVLEMLLPPQSLARLGAQPTTYQPGTLVFGGEVYDLGIGFDGTPDLEVLSQFGLHGFRHRGQNTLGNPKKPWKLKFFKDRLFDRGERERFGGPRRRINLNALWTNKDFLREHLAHRAFEDLGAPDCYSEHVRVELNEQFHGLYLHLEQPDEDFLRRNGLDGDGGELWKANEGADAKATSGYEKKTALPLGDQALRDLIARLLSLRTDEHKRLFVDERIDVPRFLDYLVATAVISNADHPHKNHYMFHDPATGRWLQTPWDMDLTWGQNFECVPDCAGGLLPPGGSGRDCLRWRNHILLGTRLHQKCDQKWNLMIDVFLGSEKHNGLFRERIREAASEYLTLERLGPVIDDLKQRIGPEAALDRVRWGSYGNSSTWNHEERIEELKRWIPMRREFLIGSLPPPLIDFSCSLAPGRILRLSWSGAGPYRRILVRIGPPGEWGTQIANLPGGNRSADLPLDPSLRGELEVHLSALGPEDIYTPSLTCRIEAPALSGFIRADATGDGTADIDDAVAILEALFGTAGPISCPAAADADGDGAIQINDPIYILNHRFRGGPPPPSPYPGCGEDGADLLPCEVHAACT